MKTNVVVDKPWYSYLADCHRHDFLSCLQELSRLQDKTHPAFLLIGGAALLLRGVVRRVQWWDIDLIFRDQIALFDLLRVEKCPQLRVEFMEEGGSQQSKLHFVHTTWCFGSRWINVDCIIRDGYFDFYLATIETEKPHCERVEADNQTYRIQLLVGHPWDVIIDKLTLERFEVSLEVLSSLNKDLPHIWDILRLSGEDPSFYSHVTRQTDLLGKRTFMQENLLTLLSCANELGYDTEEISPEVLEYARRGGI